MRRTLSCLGVLLSLTVSPAARAVEGECVANIQTLLATHEAPLELIRSHLSLPAQRAFAHWETLAARGGFANVLPQNLLLDVIANARNDDQAIEWVQEYFADKDCHVTRLHAVTYIVNARAQQAQQETSE